MSDPYNITLSPEQIANFDYYQAEEKSVYIRYLLMREHREEVIMKYYFYLELIEAKLKFHKPPAVTSVTSNQLPVTSNQLPVTSDQ